MNAFPTLETERLILRAPREADLDTYSAFRADAEASRYVGGALSRNDTWRVIATVLGHAALRGYSMFAVEEKASNAFVGICGPWFPAGFPEPELGWQIVTKAQGRGYATEATRAARTFAYDRLGWKTAISLIAPENNPSAKVAERLGAHWDGSTFDWRGTVCHVWRHPPPEIPSPHRE